LPAALAEAREAARFYESKIPGLGLDFLRELRAGIGRILAHPHAWRSMDHEYRRCLVSRFPFGIIYRMETNSILIVSVMHLHREPGAWRTNV
jgi:plasmid stabilization system protein ParE